MNCEYNEDSGTGCLLGIYFDGDDDCLEICEDCNDEEEGPHDIVRRLKKILKLQMTQLHDAVIDHAYPTGPAVSKLQRWAERQE